MQPVISPIISVNELLLLAGTKKILLIDASAGPGAKEKYLVNHLAGALFVDLETQLADVKTNAADGGRHPLPTPNQFATMLTAIGISADSHVIIYDDKSGANAAARFWWMLAGAGHKAVQVLDGGINAAIEAGFPTSAGDEIPQKNRPYPESNWQYPLADLEEIKQVIKDDNFIVIDVRDSYRYFGEKEPIDLIAGHIPGAINIPFSSNLDAKGLYLSPALLKEKYTNETGGKQASHIIVHCGSGVTACHTILAMAYAGMEIPKLYVGSWSEWSRCNLPMATSERY